MENTEVLVSRKSRKRVSRALIGVMGCTILVGSVFYFRNNGNPQEAQAATDDLPTSSSDTTVAIAKPAEQTGPITLSKPAEVKTIATASTPTVSTSGNSATAMVVAAAVVTTQPTTKPVEQPKVLPVAPVSNVPTLNQARAKADAGQQLAARNDYNSALASGRLSPTDAQAAKSAIMDLNKTIVFSPRKYTDDTWASSYTVKSGDRMQKIANQYDVTWELLCRINGMTDPRKLRAGQTLKTLKGPFHAIVSKQNFTIDLYLGAPGGAGSMFVTQFSVGLGKDDGTPLGTWMVKPQSKLKNPTYYNPREEGDRIVHADDPQNPLGEYWLGLVGIDGHAVGKESYGIHGTIEPDTIGKMASLGCIRLLNENVAQVFDMLVETKSTVVVTD